jgi:hypothetical protein
MLSSFEQEILTIFFNKTTGKQTGRNFFEILLAGCLLYKLLKYSVFLG